MNNCCPLLRSRTTLCNVCISEIELNVSDNQVYISVVPLAIKLLPFNVCCSSALSLIIDVTTCLENEEMAGSLTAVREMSAN